MKRALKPDAQPFDEVRITTVPRYKMSGLSGDEWRISGKIQLLRKGNVCHEAGFRDVEACIDFLKAEWHRACDDGKGYYAGEGEFCDQEGCAEKATVTYKVLKEFCKDRPHEHQQERTDGAVRKFCARHSTRGDCGFDDADANYFLVSGKQWAPKPQDVRESARVEVRVDNLDDLPAAIDKARKAKG